MLPYILAAVGGYLIGDSLKGKQFAEGGIMDSGKQFAERGTNTFMTTEQIIENFNNAFISISKVETNGKENGMICTIYRDTPKFFPTYYSAWNFYNSKNLL